jgi:hypothetical protein
MSNKKRGSPKKNQLPLAMATPVPSLEAMMAAPEAPIGWP